jgi:uncharacterized protein Smg (DUF494 family)
MKTEQVTSAIGTGRVMEIILFLVGEIRRNKQIGDIDLKHLSDQGFTETEVSTAFSWLFDKMALSGKQSVASNPRNSPFRIYHEMEQSFLTQDARGYLMQLRELELLKDSEMELLIDRLWFLGAADVGLEAVKEAATELIFDFSDASRLDNRMMLNVTDKVQ